MACCIIYVVSQLSCWILIFICVKYPLTESLPFVVPLPHSLGFDPGASVSVLYILDPCMLRLILKIRPSNAVLRKRTLKDVLAYSFGL